jgi:hypothetical protein
VAAPAVESEDEVGHHSSEPAVIALADGAELPVYISQFVAGDETGPITLRVDSDEISVEQAEQLAAVLTNHVRRLREITQA